MKMDSLLPGKDRHRGSTDMTRKSTGCFGSKALQEEEEADAPGIYLITQRSGVSETNAMCARTGDFISKLNPGQMVEVLEVCREDAQRRVRARIRHPTGWISLMNTETAFRWAERQYSLPAGRASSSRASPAGGGASSAEEEGASSVPHDESIVRRLDAFFDKNRETAQMMYEASGLRGRPPTVVSELDEQASRAFRVVVPTPYPGVQFRRSKHSDDKHGSYAKHGTIVTGRVEDGGHWLRVLSHEAALGQPLFLPLRLAGADVLLPLSPDEAAAALASRSRGASAEMGAAEGPAAFGGQRRRRKSLAGEDALCFADSCGVESSGGIGGGGDRGGGGDSASALGGSWWLCSAASAAAAAGLSQSPRRGLRGPRPEAAAAADLPEDLVALPEEAPLCFRASRSQVAGGATGRRAPGDRSLPELQRGPARSFDARSSEASIGGGSGLALFCGAVLPPRDP